MEFWLSRSLSHELFFFHDGILAIMKPFHEFFFHTVESRLSWSLFTNSFFTQWNLGYHRAFSRFFLSHSGISSITEPFHEFFFHPVESRLSRSHFTNFSFFTMESTKCTIWGKTLFIYITKSIYIGSTSLKTLPLDLEPPLQGKEYNPPYSNEIAKKKANVFVLEVTYRRVTQILFF
jgi:hypothetical protein